MKNFKKVLALLLSLMMIITSFAGLFIVNAEEGAEDGSSEVVNEDKKILLGLGGRSDTPFGNASKFGQRFQISEGDVLKNIHVLDVATYDDGNVNTGTVKVWQWDTDYDTTVANEPLYTADITNHNNCAQLNVAIPTELAITGDVYYEVEYLTGTGAYTGWQAKEGAADGVETYLGGVLQEGKTYVATVTVYGAPLPPDPNESSTEVMYEYNFGKYTETAGTDFGFVAHNNLSVSNLCNSGYITMTATGADPYVAFGTLPEVPTSQADYIVVKYRTNVTTDLQFFAARSDGVGWGQPGSNVVMNITGDTQWHVGLIDASEVWGNVKDVKFTNVRIDPLNADAGDIDISYIKFFATAEGAQACIESETITKEVSGELIEGDDRIVMVGEDVYYTADPIIPLTAIEGGEGTVDGDYTDADGNVYTKSGFRLLKDGLDTGLTIFTSADGKVYGIGQAIGLTYQDPWEGAVEIDGDMYTYTTKTVVTPKYNPVAPEDNSIPADSLSINIPLMSPDTLFAKYEGEDEITLQDGSAHSYIAAQGGKIYDVDKKMENFSLRGWGWLGAGVEIESFGYMINNGEAIFASDPIKDDAITAAVGQSAMRYKITIDVSDLSEGVYNVYPLAKGVDGTVYYLNVWGSIQFAKGGSWELAGYTAGNDLYTISEGVVFKNGVATEAKMAENDGTYIVYDGVTNLSAGSESTIDYTKPVGDAYVVNLGDNAVTVNNGEMTTWPEAGYNVEGSKMYNLWGQNGAIVFNSLPFADYNTVEFIVTSDASVADEYPIGFITDVAHPYGLNQTVGSYDYTADLAHGMIPVASKGEPNLSGRGNGAGWNAVERLIRVDISNVDYTGAVAISVGSVAPNTILVVDVRFRNYEVIDNSPKGKYVYDTTLTYVAAPEIPVNPTELVPVYIVDGPALNTTGGLGTNPAEYSYEDGFITYTSLNADPHTTANLVPAGTVIGPYMVVKYRTTSEGAQGECFVGVGAAATGPDNVQYPSTYIADGEWHTMVVYLGTSADYDHATNIANHFRNDFVKAENQSIDVEYYAFFNTEKEAKYYAENNMHVLPEPLKDYTITFVADGEVVGTRTYTEGDKILAGGAPQVPKKEGYKGKWEKFELGNSDITVNAIYTPIETEAPETTVTPETTVEPGAETTVDPETSVAPETTVEPETSKTPAATNEPETSKSPATTTKTPAATSSTPAATTAAGDDGCGSVVGTTAVALIAVTGVAVVVVSKKKKEED